MNKLSIMMVVFAAMLILSGIAGAVNTSLGISFAGASDNIPVITLVGDNPVTVEKGHAYSDAGATADDIEDGDITDYIVTDDSVVDTSIVGSYVVTYDVDDSNGNAAVTVERTVNVVDDTTAPAEVSGLASGTVTASSIQWTWMNPIDSDFVNTLIKVVKTSDGSVIAENIALVGTPGGASEYTAIGLEPGTSYTITVQTQDNAQ